MSELRSEFDGYARARRDVASRCWRLLAGYAAADCFQFEARVLCSFNGSPECLSHERRDFDAALLHIYNNGAIG